MNPRQQSNEKVHLVTLAYLVGLPVGLPVDLLVGLINELEKANRQGKETIDMSCH